MAERTWWNGEPAVARRVVVIVADVEFPRYWARPFVGQERDAVEVVYEGQTFYLDDEGYEQPQEEYDRLVQAAESLSSSTSGRITVEQACAKLGIKPQAEDGSHLKVGYPGHGWNKVTVGQGSPQYGHSSLVIERVVRERHPATS